ncbi:MAG: carboxylating nicotinate-nucleotide diphosphorylase [Saprospiraceae bacterium]|nr:carboxylating nicotinate-nucleotide diphosphorylase [Saprospiraceae bacterium]
MDLKRFIEESLSEDVRSGDITSLACVPITNKSVAQLKVKDDGVLAGVEFARMVFDFVDPAIQFEQTISDGTSVKYGDIAFEVRGSSRDLLKAERLVLNAMQRMSGIASLSRKFAEAVSGLPVTILDTRKTTPLNRQLEKWAVRIGGCHNYRDGLYDWFMIKDNHIEACGSITDAIKAVKAYQHQNGMEQIGITVEVRNLDECEQVLSIGGVNRIMLDNFDTGLLKEAVSLIDHRFETEASGGVNLQTVRPIALCGVDFISVGALTHSAGSLDLSLKIQ